ADFICLRVLVLDRFWTNNLSISIGKLIHLRYLDISECSVNKLFQESIPLLYNLQTLKLENIKSGLSKNLRKLINLRHLEFYRIHDIQQIPSHIGKLIHLQTLSEFAVGIEKGCKIEELGPLKNLKGALNLTNLEKVQSKEEARAAKLVEKKNLHHLLFHWTFFYKEGEYDKYNKVQVLEGLQPHKNLQSLNISGFRGEVLPNSTFVENLVDIHLFNCKRCEVLPMLGQLPNLKKLEISLLDSLRSIGNEFYGIDSNQRNYFAFPQLKKFYIDGMKNLEKWDELITPNLFGSLKNFSILGCDKLTKLPGGIESCQSIEYLSIHQCPNLMLNVQNLHNLYRLDINGMKRLPEGLGGLTNLKELVISGRMQNYESSDNAATQLPQQLQHLTNLEVLMIADFDSIEALPEWLGNLTSLRTLSFLDCKNLKELPSREAMLCLTKLDDLLVFRCPKLLVGEGDQEGPKLSHLPTKCVCKM
ncbi:disease resistance protein RGA2-like, partial [Benincasa hispida]|uniref:disease resistance protein RGA2-like n=1 Tax=Benincasa hispida TaxID=102211 RepID=UPI001900540F